MNPKKRGEIVRKHSSGFLRQWHLIPSQLRILCPHEPRRYCTGEGLIPLATLPRMAIAEAATSWAATNPALAVSTQYCDPHAV
jgi:hypothetical protein